TLSEGQGRTGRPGASNTRARSPGCDPRQHRQGCRHFTSDRRQDRQGTWHRHTVAATQRHQASTAERGIEGGMAMSTFAVFGMTRAYALAEARKRTPTHRFEKDKCGTRRRVEMTSDEWEAAVQDRADSIMGGGKSGAAMSALRRASVCPRVHPAHARAAGMQGSSNPCQVHQEGWIGAAADAQEDGCAHDRVAGLGGFLIAFIQKPTRLASSITYLLGFGGFTFGIGRVFWTGGRFLSFVCMGRLGVCFGGLAGLSLIIA